MEILSEIINKRKQLLNEKGHCQGEPVPETREIPVLPFPQGDGLICEIKRKSPSKKDINPGLDPIRIANEYVRNGVRSISVLTEPNYFGGSLSDLISVKKANPNVAVLRKDFILDREDIDIAYRAGADAVLLIAAAHDTETLKDLYAYANGLGLSVLFEAHDREDLLKAKKIKPKLLGINTRDLQTFKIDPAAPFRLKSLVNWRCRLVYESGIHSGWQASFAASCGASALLIGESAVKAPELINEIRTGFCSPIKSDFWHKLYGRSFRRPLIKICGTTIPEDAKKADKLGADIIGFIFARSKRRISADDMYKMPKLKALKAGIIVLENGKGPEPEILELVDKGKLDVLQIHGDISEALPYSIPFYQTLAVKDETSLAKIKSSFAPRLLIDAYSPDLHGGTGKKIDETLVKRANGLTTLWLAGGLNPENINGIVRKYRPEMIDAVSGLESSPGRKDHELMERYFQQIRLATEKKHEMA